MAHIRKCGCGRVNRVTTDEAREHNIVLVGTLLVNSHPTVVLFDSGALYSFVKEGYVLSNSIVTETLHTAFRIEVPSAKLQTIRVVSKAKILIR